MKRSPSQVPSEALQQVPLADIVIPSGRKRSLHAIDELQRSIAEVGLLNPIVLTEQRHLVAGLHRLEACRALGWTAIAARLLPLSAVDAELAEIDENLCRTELTVLERAEHLARRKSLYEARHPEVRHGAAKGKAGGGKVARAKEEIISSFAANTADTLGTSTRSVAMEVQIAETLSEEIRVALRGTPVADRKVDLLALARMTDAVAQRQVVELLVQGEATTVAGALKQIEARAPVLVAEPEMVYDRAGHPIHDPGIAEAFTVIHERTAEVLRHLRAAKRAWGHFHEEQVAAGRVHVFGSYRGGGYSTLRKVLEHELHFMIYMVKSSAPYGLCPYCGGAPWSEDRRQACAGCGGVGWGERRLCEDAPPEMIAALDAKGLREGRAEGEVAGVEEEDAGVTPPELTPGQVSSYQEAAEQARARMAGTAGIGPAPNGG